MTTLSPHALLVPTDVAEAAAGGMETDVTSLGEGILAAAINAATREVEESIGRRLHVHADTVQLKASDWDTSSHEVYAYEAWLPLWPLVEVTTAGVTLGLGTAYPGGQIVYANERYTELAGFFGYRRPEETLATLVTVDGLADLTVLPEVLWDIVRDTAAELVLCTIDERASGGYSGGRKMQTIGTNMVTVEAPDPLRRTRILSRLKAWRAIAV